MTKSTLQAPRHLLLIGSKLTGIESVVVQPHTEIRQLHVMSVIVRPQLVQKLFQLGENMEQKDC